MSRRELDRLAVLRVMALAYPDQERVEVFRADVVELLAVVDRLMAEPRVHTLVTMTMGRAPAVAFMAGSMRVDQSEGRR